MAAAASSAECLSCGECAAARPASGALDLGCPGRAKATPAAVMAMGAGFFFLGVFALQLLDFDRVSGRQEATPLAKFAEPSGKPEGEIKAELALPADFSGATAWGEVLGMVPVARKARAAKGNEAP